MSEFRPRRSALYMPGSNARALKKAKTLPADCLLLDLEDAVAPEAKIDARESVCMAAMEGGYGYREIVIRINALTTQWGKSDLAAIATTGVDAVLVPKIETADDVEIVRGLLVEAGAPNNLSIWAMIETPRAIINAASIAEEGPVGTNPLGVFVMGTNDLAKETGAALVDGRMPMLSWLSTCVVAASANGIDIIDGVYNNFRDEEGFASECMQGRVLGMVGKSLIHPSQIGPCNDVFSPDKEDVEWARKVIAAFAEPENQGKGAITVDGRMVEYLHAEIAERTLAIFEAISANAE